MPTENVYPGPFLHENPCRFPGWTSCLHRCTACCSSFPNHGPGLLYIPRLSLECLPKNFSGARRILQSMPGVPSPKRSGRESRPHRESYNKSHKSDHPKKSCREFRRVSLESQRILPRIPQATLEYSREKRLCGVAACRESRFSGGP